MSEDLIKQDSSLELFEEMTLSELEEREVRIQQNRIIIKDGFVEIGLDLKEIRDRRGYKLRGYDTFEEYVKERWGWQRDIAYKYIKASEIASNVDTCLHLELHQAIELSRLTKPDPDPTDHRKKVIDFEMVKEVIRETPLDKTSVRELSRIVKEKKREIRQAEMKESNDRQISLSEDSEYDIRSGDVLDILDSIRNDYYDLIFVDPPYGIIDEEWDTFSSDKEFWDWTSDWLHKLIPKLRSTGRLYICFAQERMFELYELMKQYTYPIDPLGLSFGNLLIWNYKNNIKWNNPKKYHKTYDPIFYYYGINADALNMEREEVWGGNYNNLDCWTIAIPQSNFNDKKMHPAQKPIELLRNIIRTGSKSGDKVLDPFAGSGTTGVVCKELKRDFTLIEKNPEYIEIIKRRLN